METAEAELAPGAAAVAERAGLLVASRGALGEGLAAALGDRWAFWRSPGLPAPLAGGRFEDPVVYVAGARGRHGLPDPADAEVVLAAAASGGARQVLVVANTGVHEPSPHHPGNVREERWRARRSGNALAAAWLELERAAAAVVPADRLLLLRAAPVPLPGGDDLWSRAVFARVAPSAFGWDPMVQLLALEDLVRALEGALATGLVGTYHLAPEPAPARRAVRSAGALRLPVPASLWKLGRRVAGRPAEEVETLVHPATVSGAALAERLGEGPRFGTLEAARRNRGDETSPAAASDPFGFDLAYRRRFGRTVFRFLHDRFWRVDTQGLEHVPASGRAILVGVHRGFQPWDGVMVQQSVHERTGRYARFLMHPGLVKMPVLAPYMTRIGGLLATGENAAWVLERDELLGVFPEGIRGAFSMYRDSYRLTPYFRDDFAAFAIRHQAPVVPFVTVGTAETFPIVGRVDWEWWRRVSLWPFLPVTTPLPLPAKWHTRILPPVAVDRFRPEDADDPAVVAGLADEVRERLAGALADLVARRRSRFFGGLRVAPERAPGPPDAPASQG